MTFGKGRIEKRHGTFLPHWTREGGMYAVTFRLADSMPESVRQRILIERDEIVRRAEYLERSLSEFETERLAYLHSPKIEEYLDAGHGACWMKDPRVADIVEKAILHFDGERYDLAAWCVMPNHVHVVFSPRAEHQLQDIMHSWKSFSASAANKVLDRSGEFWLSEYYDHLIRGEKDFAHALKYVRENPTKAGLRNWRWVGERERGEAPRLGQDAQATSEKAAARAAMKAALLATPDAARAEWSRAICRVLAASDLLPSAGAGSGGVGAVMLYAPILAIGEVDIAPLADDLARRGVDLCIPRHDWTTRAMTPVRVANLTTDLVASAELVNQRLGLRAARPGAEEVPLDRLAAVVVPGLAFDHRGHRLGRGGGFYDRFLARLTGATRVIGVAFDVQVVPEVPVDGHDARLGALVTEARVERFGT